MALSDLESNKVVENEVLKIGTDTIDDSKIKSPPEIENNQIAIKETNVEKKSQKSENKVELKKELSPVRKDTDDKS